MLPFVAMLSGDKSVAVHQHAAKGGVTVVDIGVGDYSAGIVGAANRSRNSHHQGYSASGAFFIMDGSRHGYGDYVKSSADLRAEYAYIRAWLETSFALFIAARQDNVSGNPFALSAEGASDEKLPSFARVLAAVDDLSHGVFAFDQLGDSHFAVGPRHLFDSPVEIQRAHGKVSVRARATCEFGFGASVETAAAAITGCLDRLKRVADG